MWYTLKTEKEQEDRMCSLIRQTVDSTSYGRCFVAKRQMVWRLKGGCRMHEEPLLPGYIVVVTDTPQQFVSELKKIPYYSVRLEYGENVFTAISMPEEQFLSEVMELDSNSGHYSIPLSPVEVDDTGELVRCGGVLEPYRGHIVKKRIRNRYVIVRVALMDRNWDVYMGIRLPGDYGKDEELSYII